MPYGWCQTLENTGKIVPNFLQYVLGNFAIIGDLLHRRYYSKPTDKCSYVRQSDDPNQPLVDNVRHKLRFPIHLDISKFRRNWFGYQCENWKILLPPRFYVKSMKGNLKRTKTVFFFQFCRLWILIFCLAL